MSELQDIFGTPVKEGDVIAAGMAYGKSSVLRVGVIIGIKEKVETRFGGATWTKYSIRVRWTHNGADGQSYCPVKESTILYQSDYTYAKFVVLPNDYVNQFPSDIKESE